MALGLDGVLRQHHHACSFSTKVERMTPVTVLPYSCFSPYAPYAVRTSFEGSDSSGKDSPSFSRNRASLAGGSGDRPSTR